MILFMILAFPLLAAYSLLDKTFYVAAAYKKISIIFGFLLASLYSFFVLFFIPAYYLTPYAFLPNFLYSFTHDTFFPIVFCSLFLFLLVKKFQYKWHELYYIMLGFYIVFFPARSLNINTIFGLHALFVKPVLMVSMVYVLKNILQFSYKYIEISKEMHTSKKDIAIKIVIVLSFLVCLAFPSVFEALYMIGALSWILIPIALLFCSAVVYGSSIVNKKYFV